MRKTLQKILATINSHEPDIEVFALMYAFECRTNAATFINVAVAITGEPAKRRCERVLAFQPLLKDRIAMIEASVISYFKTQQFNNHYLHFPGNRPVTTV